MLTRFCTHLAYTLHLTIRQESLLDQDGKKWSEFKVVIFMYDRLDEGWSLRKIQRYVLEKAVPTRTGKPVWGRQTIRQIAQCPNYTGKAVAFRWQKVEGKKHMVLVEHIRYPQLVIDRMHELFQQRNQRNDAKTIHTQLTESKKKKRDLERMLIDLENEEEEHRKIDKAIGDFLLWCEKVRPFIDDPDYTPTYVEKRRAVVILGITATIFPAGSDIRSTLDLKPPSIMEVLTAYSGEYIPYTHTYGESGQWYR